VLDATKLLFPSAGNGDKIKFLQVEKSVRGQSLTTRLEIAIDMMCDELFAHPEISNLRLTP